MNQKGSYGKIIAAFGSTCFILILFFVSLLGENNKADMAVLNFLKNTKKYDFERAERELAQDAQFYDQKKLTFEDFAFLLELSLLSTFNISDSEVYQIDVKRDSFWIPYVSEKRMGISVRFNNKDSSIFQSIPGINDSSYIKNLFILERKKGVWRIIDIRTDAPSISDTFSSIEKKLAETNYYIETKNGFVLNGFEFSTKDVSLTDKRLYNHMLQKAIRSMRGQHCAG